MWLKHNFFKYGTAIALGLLIIYLLGAVQFIVDPVIKFITTLFFPLLFAGFLYYILKPLVLMIAKTKFVPKTLAILLVFSIIIGGFILAGFTVGGTIENQVVQFAEDVPSIIEKNQEQTKEIIEQNNYGLFSYEEMKQKLFTYVESLSESLTNNVTSIISTITNFVTVLVIVPFILFYFLKDGHRLLPFLLKFLPEKHRDEGKRILIDIDKTLSNYIGGQMIVALVNGILMYIGYLIIGLDYAIALALFVVITAVIPLIGPVLGVLPAIIVALIMDPFMIVKILILLVIVQQLEGNFVSPLVIGNKLSIHPLTVILLLLVAGSIYGLIGVLIAVPVYSVLKVITKNLYRFYRLREGT
ncbi:AI-2E family transporter [Aquibacillus rhizosphaerae]|uniref:AI-2E family transporter n=1 Tax=Aquibacillus rhizosphaerae TaxID=3051431 RepID=A0ABT7L7D6_9BACI|nr:AI-2E family transporter [Aquibacillus sp. LR5S19]MDL4841779.1 AI-2E family transporter [Aquibacillus sp. LR5S19]